MRMWFIKQQKTLLVIATAVVLLSAAVIVKYGIPFGIDFTGGTLLEVEYSEAPTEPALEAALAPEGLGEFSVRETVSDTGNEGFIIRARDMTEEERVAVEEAVTVLGSEGEVVRYTSIGPVIGQELASKAVWAIGAVSLVIILYVAFAFAGVSYPVGSWVYGGITIVALLHDVIVPAAAMTLLGLFVGVEADVLFIMALLAVLGYSVNDTIVVFDRVRENLKQFRNEEKTTVVETGGMEREEVNYTLTRPFAEIVGLSVDQTIARSLLTSTTTFLALAALYTFGGAVTQTFALILMVGVVAGTYSSLCIANPLLVYVAERKLAKEATTMEEKA